MGVVHLDQVYRRTRAEAPLPAPSVKDIVEACAAEWGTTPALIYGPRRQKPIVLPRQAAMCLAAALRPDLSYPTIARLMQRQDHTTVMHAVRRTSWRARTDDAFAAHLRAVEERLQRTTSSSEAA